MPYIRQIPLINLVANTTYMTYNQNEITLLVASPSGSSSKPYFKKNIQLEIFLNPI